MPRRDDSLVARMDRIGVARVARSAGLAEPLADRVAEVVVESGLPEDRRAEVFRELVAHFEDGLGAGRTPEELLAAFGEGRFVGRMVRREKRLVTPEDLGGSGARDGLVRRLGRDVRYAIRRLAARPAFTVTAVLSLALGLGANAAMFSLVNDLLLRRPSVAQPDRLMEVYYSHASSGFDPLAYPDLEDVSRDAADVFSAVGGTRLAVAPRGDGDAPEQVFVELVTGNYFELLGLRPAVGRLIEPSDAPAPGGAAVAVLSHSYWRRSFGGDPAAVGRTIRLTGATYTVVGVAPADYPGSFRGIGIDVFVPVTMVAQIEPSTIDHFTNRGNHGTFAKARLQPAVTAEQARVSLARIAADFKARRLGAWQGDDAFVMIPVSDVIIWPPLDRFLVPVAWMLMVVVGLVLVIACANLAAFLLARAVDRRKEIAVRLAMGATRGQLVGQLLVETVLLALAGGVVGVIVGRGALRAVLAADLPLPLPISLGLTLDGRVLGFSIAVSVAAGVLFGLAPALQSTRLELASVIRDESTGGGRSRGRLRGALVAGQVAVSVMLLVAAGLFVRSFDAARRVDPGFGGPPAALAWIGIPAAPGEAAVLRTLERIEQRVAEVPGVRTVGAAENLHLNTLSTSSAEVLVDGVAPPPGRQAHEVDQTAVDSGFVAAAGLTLLSGRTFTAADGPDGPRVALVNAAFAERFWPGAEAVGRRFRRLSGEEYGIVGVVKTAKVRSLAEEPRPFVYFALSQNIPQTAWVVARTAGPADPILAALTRAIREADADVFVIRTYTMARHLDVLALPIRLGAAALGAFALLALVMASVGLYGTVSYSVAQRTREVGIRLSLGADQGMAVRLLLWGGLRLVMIGAAAGLLLALIVGRLLEGLLFGVAALDPLTFAAVPLVLGAVALLAAWVPARRAGRVSPIAALRAE